MCLELKKGSRLMTAKRDITVYKALTYKDCFDEKLDGLPFAGIVNGIDCVGTLSVHDGDLYFCTDNPELNGCDSNDKKGHKYSWVFCSGDLTKDIFVGESYESPFDLKPTETLCTAYVNATVKIGNEYRSRFEIEHYHSCSEVSEGLHSFAELRRLKSLVSQKKIPAINRKRVIAECVIPKGAKYYVGTFLYGCKSYASDRLRYVKLL